MAAVETTFDPNPGVNYAFADDLESCHSELDAEPGSGTVATFCKRSKQDMKHHSISKL